MENKISGVITALITPFKKGELDRSSFLRLIKQQLDQGVQGFVINGTTGESPTLKIEEVEQLVQWTKGEAGEKVPLIIGCGTNSTQKTKDLAERFAKLRPQAFLVVVPYYNRPPQRGQIAHFKAVAEATTVPVILYNVPGRTVARLESESIVELSQVKNICGIKEATGDLKFFSEFKNKTEKNFSLLSGDDGTCIDFIQSGGDGVISVCSHLIGQEMIEMLKQKKNQFTEKYGELMKHLYIEPNPIPVKMALHWMGVIESPELRLPLVALEEKFHKDFKQCLQKIGKL